MNFRAFITATEDFGNSEKRHRWLSFIIILNMRDIVLIGTSGSGCNAAGFLHVKLQRQISRKLLVVELRKFFCGPEGFAFGKTAL